VTSSAATETTIDRAGETSASALADGAYSAGSGLHPLAWAPVSVTAITMCTLELLVAGRYGFHRDELYFLACARHLAWGYVDQPPLVPAVARAVLVIFGPSVFWLRVLPALAGAGTVYVSALTARELGGRRTAQLIAGVAAATSPQALAAFHLLSTTVFDMFCWSVITWLVCRMLRTGDTRLWVAIGLLSGIALLDKLNVLFLILALLVGLAFSTQRAVLRSPWLVVGAGLVLLLASPDIAWNATHQWAQLSMTHSLHQENSTLGASLAFIPEQFIVVGIVLAWVWVPGLVWLVRNRRVGPLGVAYLVLLALYALSGAKSYYLAGMYYVLFAAGGVAIEARLASRPTDQARRSVRCRVALIVLAAVITLPLTLPVLPQRVLASGPWEGSINKDLSATVGWRQMVTQLSVVADRLPSSQRSRLVIFTGDYGAAGAVDLYGPAEGLPHAISGHNNYWWWGPGGAPDRSTTIAINLSRTYLLTIFIQVRYEGHVKTPGGAWTEERGDPIWLCTGQYRSWTEAWKLARHYD
jgi:hypothetical protein